MTLSQRIIIAAAIAAGFTVAGSTSLRAQDYVPTPVTISSDKVNHDGKICYAHVVLEKQTLFSIAKAYGVTIDQIKAVNKDLDSDALRAGSILYVPFVENAGAGLDNFVATPDTASADTPDAESDGETTIHVVKWNDTLWSISQQYGVTVDQIIEANDLKEAKIKRRQKLIIPKPMMANTVVTPVMATEEEIERGATIEIVENITEDDGEIVSPESDFENPDGWSFNLHARKNVTLSLLIPFTSGGKRSSGNIDFYCGALLAMADLKDKGITTNLNVFDVTGDLAVSDDKLEGSDIVIGPISPSAISKELGKCEDGVYLVSPLDQKALSLTTSASNLIQAPVPLNDQYLEIADWIAEEYTPGETVLLISDTNHAENDFASAVKNALTRHSISYSTFSYGITQGRTISGTIAGYLKKDAPNRVVVLSTQEAFLGDAIRNLNVLSRKSYDIVLYSPSKVRDYDTSIESEYLHNLKLHMTASYNIDYNDRKVMDFILRYRALYNTEPSKMAFQGYDTAYYFASMLTTYGMFYKPFMQNMRFDLLQASFKFEKTDSGSFVNHAVRRVIYDPDYTVRSVKL